MRPLGRVKRLFKRACLWHVDAAVRYAPAVKLIRRHAAGDARILEIGSGSMGLTLFLPRPVTGYDVSHHGPDLGLLTPVKATPGDAALAFDSDRFDFVVSMDTLEHIPPDRRPTLISEMIRVSREWVIVALPCGSVSLEYDRRLYDWCTSSLGIDYRWVREHLELGLPEAAEVEGMIRQSIGRDGSWRLRIVDNFNVDLWLRVWKFQMSRSRVWRSFKNKLLWPFFPWIAGQNRPPAYRKIFILRRIQEG